MFTGIIQDLAVISNVNLLTDGIQVSVNSNYVTSKASIGDSVAVNGVCSTIISFDKNSFMIEYMKETLEKSSLSTLKKGDIVNLELCLKPQDYLGGHYVTGHIDVIGRIKLFEKNDPWAIIKVSFPKQFSHLIVNKGSITMDGISLTIVDIGDDYFTVHLIPHTLKETVLNSKKCGDYVNLEFDLMAKYWYRFYTQGKAFTPSKNETINSYTEKLQRLVLK